ncbi:aromatic amino acid transaminase [Sphingosinicella microcystinivorans]|uniref:amino acid aminotransferase n=1 Tax=Sphingosinicella microcystinivorans TaxID=335406 RepID=UPI0022F3B057|nr:amino acid aminotransferase [Sphingosinicella microcystinivorans]WBX84492.1 aspartate/tyrosine/aromatic aminotransferase [Sphingosinicella microcystinivorans]
MSQAATAQIETGSVLDGLAAQPADPLLALIGLFRDDPRPGKIDMGVGVYRDAGGRTPVMAAVKAAEAFLLKDQQTKSYLGPEGDARFAELLTPIIFGEIDRARLCGVQTPGGTGALRLGAELLARGRAGARVLVGTPTWPNHVPLMEAAGLQIVPFRHFDVATQALCFEDTLAAIRGAAPGDVILLHGCCHNPTGADYAPDQWQTLAALIAERGLLPFVDLAYQGLGNGLDADAAGLRAVVAQSAQVLVAYSCDKNFGLYRERVGALFAVSDRAPMIQSNLLALARANWSMPPDHGAAVVRTILDSADLTASWRAELEAMRLRIRSVREGVAACDPALAGLTQQTGMFSMLPLSPEQIRTLREVHAVYMAGSGRINVAGLTPDAIPAFAAAVAAVR